jgi:hypothetical protein
VLVGSTVRCSGQLRPLALPLLLALRHALCGFQIMLARFGCWAATLGQSDYDDFEALLCTRDDQAVVHPHAACRLHALAVEMHQSPGHRLGGLRTALEKTGETQPLVKAQLGGWGLRLMLHGGWGWR